MNRLTATFFTLLAGLLLGFLAARSWSEANKPAPAPEASPKTRHAANPPHDDSTVATQTGRTPTSRPATNDSGTPPAVTPATTHPAHIPIARILPPEDSTVRIPRKFLSKIQCMVFNTTSNCVTDDIVELLNISPEERERLDHLITTTRTKVEEHELDRATVTEIFAKFQNARQFYLLKDWDRAETLFRQVLELQPQDGPSRLYLSRLAELRMNPPPEGWDGVYTATVKG